MTKFHDTSSLLCENSLSDEGFFYLSYVTLSELENIKTSGTKSEDVKFKARKLTRWLDENPDKYEVLFESANIPDVIWKFKLAENNDSMIVSTAYILNMSQDITFVTNDLCLKSFARMMGLRVESVNESSEIDYKGYKEVTLDNEKMATFYSDLTVNHHDCLTNEYLIIRDSNNVVVDRLRWDGNKYIPLNAKTFKSRALGTIRPLDEIQMCVFDSITNNDMTLLYGRAGSGKTTIPLYYFMQCLESEKIKKLYIIYHYETLKGAKTLGYEKGSHDEKLFNTASIGNILASKFKDFKLITTLLGTAIEIIPTCNLRGVEFGSEEAIFVTECQNINPYVMKTIVQRCKDGCKQVYEGDMLEQSDVVMSIKGMERVIDVFSGHKKFGCVKLKNNYRSELCELADKI